MFQQEIIFTPYSKQLKVYVQGNLEEGAAKTIFLTVHDWTRCWPYMEFVDCTHMAEVKKKSMWLHVILPGQDDGDELLSSDYNFPSMDDVAKDLAVVLDAFRIRGTVIGFGEGSGANILLRFALLFPNRCLGLILLDATSNSADFDEHVLCRMYNWKSDGMKLWHKVVSRVVGSKLEKAPMSQKNVNAINVGRYLDAYLKRDDISSALSQKLSVDAVLITGAKSSCSQDAYFINRLNCKRTTVLVLDDRYDVMTEAPKNLTRALILFCKGVGVLTSVPLLGLEKEFQRVMEKRPFAEGDLAMARAVRMYDEDWVDFGQQ